MLERFAAELTRIEHLDENAMEALCVLLDAEDATDTARKLCQFVVASVSPGPMLQRMLEHDRARFETFCAQLAAYRDFMAALDRGGQGARPHEIANGILAARREQLERELREVTGGDVFDPDGDIDPRAVRSEVVRLMHQLRVDPERVEIKIVPAPARAEAVADGGDAGRGVSGVVAEAVEPEKTPKHSL